MNCPKCKSKISKDKKDGMVRVRNNRTDQTFWIKAKQRTSVADILYYHPFAGEYIICHNCECLITIKK